MPYSAASTRYDSMQYRRCGRSGVRLPAFSLGLWHNFGGVDSLENQRLLLRRAFDLGITHFDMANNYGPPPGSAEENFGRLFREDFRPYRDELILSSKAGYPMWPGPYGDWGSKKYIVASCDQRLRRTGLDYFDIFYHHRPDPDTPLEETMDALAGLVRGGKALYVGISNYPAEQAARAIDILQQMGVRCLIHQPRYNLLDRWVEDGLQDVLESRGVGSIAFSPLAQGLLAGRYAHGIPAGSRADRAGEGVRSLQLSDDRMSKAAKLAQIAAERGQTLAQMALAWILRGGRVTSVLVGASRVSQLEENVRALEHMDFTDDELRRIDTITGR